MRVYICGLLPRPIPPFRLNFFIARCALFITPHHRFVKDEKSGVKIRMKNNDLRIIHMIFFILAEVNGIREDPWSQPA